MDVGRSLVLLKNEEEVQKHPDSSYDDSKKVSRFNGRDNSESRGVVQTLRRFAGKAKDGGEGMAAAKRIGEESKKYR